VDRFVEAAPLISEKVPGTRFLVGGSPHVPEDEPYYEKLRRLVEELNLTPLLGFTGHVDDARAFMVAAQIVVLPSRRESLGLVLLEAMALEKPVVAFDIEGPQEIITDGKDGLLVGPDDVEGLAEAVVTLLKDPDLSRQIGKMGRETVISRFSAKTFADRISEIYDEIAGVSMPDEADTG
jgi:glycosyltransferase involved in cell wall biosynthesis